MAFLRALKKLVLGETWLLPIGTAVVVLTALLVVRPALDDAWTHAGGFVLTAGVAGVLWIAVSRSASR